MIKQKGYAYGKECFILFHKDLFDCVKTQIECKTKKKKTDFQIFSQKNAKKFTFLLKKPDFGNFRENIGIVII